MLIVPSYGCSDPIVRVMRIMPIVPFYCCSDPIVRVLPIMPIVSFYGCSDQIATDNGQTQNHGNDVQMDHCLRFGVGNLDVGSRPHNRLNKACIRTPLAAQVNSELQGLRTKQSSSSWRLVLCASISA